MIALCSNSPDRSSSRVAGGCSDTVPSRRRNEHGSRHAVVSPRRRLLDSFLRCREIGERPSPRGRAENGEHRRVGRMEERCRFRPLCSFAENGRFRARWGPSVNIVGLQRSTKRLRLSPGGRRCASEWCIRALVRSSAAIRCSEPARSIKDGRSGGAQGEYSFQSRGGEALTHEPTGARTGTGAGPHLTAPLPGEARANETAGGEPRRRSYTRTGPCVRPGNHPWSYGPSCVGRAEASVTRRGTPSSATRRCC